MSVNLPDGLHVITDPEGRVNAGFVVLGDGAGAVAIDTMFGPSDGRRLLEAVDKAGAGPVRYLILTHEHGDHYLGTGAFTCDIIGTRTCAGSVADQLTTGAPRGAGSDDGPPPRAPNIAFDGRLDLELGRRRLELHQLGGHAPGLAVIHFPDDDVVWASDLVFAGRLPFLPPHADLRRWLAALDTLLALEPRLVVPGHGEPGGPDLIRTQKNWLARFVAEAEDLLGRLDPEAAAARLIDHYQVPDRMQRGLRAVLAQLAGGLPV